MGQMVLWHVPACHVACMIDLAQAQWLLYDASDNWLIMERLCVLHCCTFGCFLLCTNAQKVLQLLGAPFLMLYPIGPVHFLNAILLCSAACTSCLPEVIGRMQTVMFYPCTCVHTILDQAVRPGVFTAALTIYRPRPRIMTKSERRTVTACLATIMHLGLDCTWIEVIPMLLCNLMTNHLDVHHVRLRISVYRGTRSTGV